MKRTDQKRCPAPTLLAMVFLVHVYRFRHICAGCESSDKRFIIINEVKTTNRIVILILMSLFCYLDINI